MSFPFSKARRAVLQALTVSVAAAGLCGQTALAQDVSTRPIRIIVPFAPGGSNDIVGREVAQRLTARLKRSVFVENRPGAGGVIGADLAAHAEPDGTTLLLISSSFTMNNAIMKLNYIGRAHV